MVKIKARTLIHEKRVDVNVQTSGNSYDVMFEVIAGAASAISQLLQGLEERCGF